MMKWNISQAELGEGHSAAVIRHPRADDGVARIAQRNIAESAAAASASYERLKEIAAAVRQSADSITAIYQETERLIAEQRQFGAECNAAMALDDVDAMIRRRDELARELARKIADRLRAARADRQIQANVAFL